MRRFWQMSKIVVGKVCRAANKGTLAGAMLALVLQLFTASMGYASDGTWIEICSDFGTEYVQVDLSDPAAPAPSDCHDCFDCVMCAGSMAALIDGSDPYHAPVFDVARTVSPAPQIIGVWVRRAWPETRGPPAAQNTADDCADCAVMASFQENGGAL